MLNDQNPTDEHKLTPPTPSTGYSVTRFTPQQEGASPGRFRPSFPASCTALAALGGIRHSLIKGTRWAKFSTYMSLMDKV